MEKWSVLQAPTFTVLFCFWNVHTIIIIIVSQFNTVRGSLAVKFPLEHCWLFSGYICWKANEFACLVFVCFWISKSTWTRKYEQVNRSDYGCASLCLGCIWVNWQGWNKLIKPSSHHRIHFDHCELAAEAYVSQQHGQYTCASVCILRHFCINRDLNHFGYLFSVPPVSHPTSFSFLLSLSNKSVEKLAWKYRTLSSICMGDLRAVFYGGNSQFLIWMPLSIFHQHWESGYISFFLLWDR